MKKRWKRVIFLCSIFTVMGIMAGCGNSGTEERIQTGEEMAIKLKGEAEDAVEQVNENTNNLMQDAEKIEE